MINPRVPRSKEGSRTKRLIESMQIIAHGVTHREGGGSASLSSAFSSLSVTVSEILAALGNVGGGGASQLLSLNLGEPETYIHLSPRLPQNLRKNSSPTFGGLTVTGASTLTGAVGCGALTSTGTIKAAGSGSALTYLDGSGAYSTPPAAGTVWSQIVNESGASLANWTQTSGSWSVVSSAFHIDTGATTVRQLSFSSVKTQMSAVVFQCDMQMLSTGGFGADNRMGVILGTNGGITSVSIGGALATMRSTGALTPSSTGKIYTEQPVNVTGGPTYNRNFNLDTFYTFKVVAIGPIMDVYIDGTLECSFLRKVDSATVTVNTILQLYAYNCRADFKNIKLYTIALP